MTGKYEITVKNRHLKYKFTITRNITILRGDSATGKTTLIEMIKDYEENGENSGVEITSEKQCRVLSNSSWIIKLKQIHDCIVFIDEGEQFVKSKEFAAMIKKSDNYYVIATRVNLPHLPYSINEIYGIKNTNGNKYQETKRLYSKFYQLYNSVNNIITPELIIVEDSNAGFEFFSYVSNLYGIKCVSAKEKSNIVKMINKRSEKNIIVIADGAAFGAEIEKVLALTNIKNLGFYFPESFEWLILKSGLIKKKKIYDLLENPSNYIESKKYFSWEQFFTAYLVEETRNTSLQYNKKQLAKSYFSNKSIKEILSNIPDGIFKL